MAYEGGTLRGWFDPSPCTTLIQNGAKAGGKRMHELVKMNTPVKTGELREGWLEGETILSKSAGPVGGDVATAHVYTEVPYAPYIESGWGLWGPSHSKYPIYPKKPGGALRFFWEKKGQWVTLKSVMHPGSHGQHMMAIAANVLESTVSEIVQPELEAWKVAVELQNRHARPGRPV